MDPSLSVRDETYDWDPPPPDPTETLKTFEGSKHRVRLSRVPVSVSGSPHCGGDSG